MGEYTTITLAVYGILTKNVMEPILEPLVPKYTEPPELKQETNWSDPDATLMQETLVFNDCCYNEQPKDPRTDLRLMSPELDNSANSMSVTVSPDSPGSKSKKNVILKNCCHHRNFLDYVRRLQHESRNDVFSLQKKRPQTPPPLQVMETSLMEER
jgi:Virilizer, N-terminal